MSVDDQALGTRKVTCPSLHYARPRRGLIECPPGPKNPGFDCRRHFRVARRGGESDRQPRVHVVRPVSRQGPPRRIQQKCLAETVVARHKVHTGMTRQLQFRSGTDILQLQDLQQNASEAGRQLRSITTGDLIRGPPLMKPRSACRKCRRWHRSRYRLGSGVAAHPPDLHPISRPRGKIATTHAADARPQRGLSAATAPPPGFRSARRP